MHRSHRHTLVLVLAFAACNGGDGDDDSGQDDTGSEDTDTGDTDTADTDSGDSADTDSGDSADTDSGDSADTDTDTDSGDTDSGDTGTTVVWPDDPWELQSASGTYQLKVDDVLVCDSTYALTPYQDHALAEVCPDCAFLFDIDSVETPPDPMPLCSFGLERWPYAIGDEDGTTRVGLGFVDDGLVHDGGADVPVERMLFAFSETGGIHEIHPLTGVLDPGTSEEQVVPGTFTHTPTTIAWVHAPAPWYSAAHAYIRGVTPPYAEPDVYSPGEWFDYVTTPAATLSGTLPCDSAEYADSFTVQVAEGQTLLVNVDTPNASNAFDPRVWVNAPNQATVIVADDQFNCTSGACEGGSETDFSCCPSAHAYNDGAAGTWTIYVAPSDRTSACADATVHSGQYTLAIEGGTALTAAGDDLHPKIELDATGLATLRSIPTLDADAHYEFEVDDTVVCDSTYALTGLEYVNDDFCAECDFMFLLDATQTARSDTNGCPNRDPWRYTFNVPYPADYPDDRAGIAHVDGDWYFQGYFLLPVDDVAFSFYDYAGQIYGQTFLTGTLYAGEPNEAAVGGTFTNNAGAVTWSHAPDAAFSPRGAYLRNCSDRTDPSSGTFLTRFADVETNRDGDSYPYVDYVTAPTASQTGTVVCSPAERVDTYTFQGAVGAVSLSVDTLTAGTRFDPIVWVNDANGCTVAMGDDQFNCTAGMCTDASDTSVAPYGCCPSLSFGTSEQIYTVYVMSFGASACADAGHSGAYTIEAQGPSSLTPVLDDHRPSVEIRASGAGLVEDMTF